MQAVLLPHKSPQVGMAHSASEAADVDASSIAAAQGAYFLNMIFTSVVLRLYCKP